MNHESNPTPNPVQVPVPVQTFTHTSVNGVSEELIQEMVTLLGNDDLIKKHEGYASFYIPNELRNDFDQIIINYNKRITDETGSVSSVGITDYSLDWQGNIMTKNTIKVSLPHNQFD